MALNYVKSQKGTNHLVHEGYRFIKDKENGDKIIWKCVDYKKNKCRGRIHTRGQQIVLNNDDHNHVPAPDAIEAKAVINTIKERARTTVESTQMVHLNNF